MPSHSRAECAILHVHANRLCCAHKLSCWSAAPQRSMQNQQLRGVATWAAPALPSVHQHRFLHNRIRRVCSCAAVINKEIWVETNDKATLLAALENGVECAVFPDTDTAVSSSQYASYRQLITGPKKGLGVDADCTYRPVEEANTGAQVARLYTVSSAQDLKRLEAIAASQPAALGQLIIMDASDWKIIPAENLVALVQAAPECRLMAAVNTAQEALTMLGALEVGTHGVLLRTKSPAEVRALMAGVKELSSQHVQLEPATVTRVTPVGLGDRVCVDLMVMLQPGEGLLAGSFARGMLLVHSECAESQYIASRPFRVNAGAVHSYVLGPSGRTAYLSELRSGSQVAVVSPSGSMRLARVGRCKLETRPMVLVEVQAQDGSTHSVILQNAETVKLVGLPQQQGTKAQSNPQEWGTFSVAALKPGDRVMLHLPGGAARHTGIAIKEWVVEQ